MLNTQKKGKTKATVGELMMTELSVDLRNSAHKTQQDLIKTKLTMEKFGVL